MTAALGPRMHERLRWRCRRGMLELDLVLNAFLERHLEALNAADLEAFNALLGRGDPELLDLVMAREEPANAGERNVLALIRAHSCNPVQF